MTDTSLAALVAESAIRRLISGYGDSVSRRDPDSVRALFTPDARVRIADGAERVGHEAIVEGLRRTLSAYSFLHQKCDTGLIDVVGDHARARLATFETNRLSGTDSLAMIFGTYEDEYMLFGKEWRFHRRRFTLQLRTVVLVSEIQQLPDLVPAFTITP
jgi:hypothetical protein